MPHEDMRVFQETGDFRRDSSRNSRL